MVEQVGNPGQPQYHPVLDFCFFADSTLEACRIVAHEIPASFASAFTCFEGDGPSLSSSFKKSSAESRALLCSSSSAASPSFGSVSNLLALPSTDLLQAMRTASYAREGVHLHLLQVILKAAIVGADIGFTARQDAGVFAVLAFDFCCW